MGQIVPGLQILHQMIGTLLVHGEGGIFFRFFLGGSVRFVLVPEDNAEAFCIEGAMLNIFFSQERLFCVGPFCHKG